MFINHTQHTFVYKSHTRRFSLFINHIMRKTPVPGGFMARRVATGPRPARRDEGEENLQVLDRDSRAPDIKKVLAANDIGISDEDEDEDIDSGESEDEIEQAVREGEEDDEGSDLPIARYIKSERAKLDKALDRKIHIIGGDMFNRIEFYPERIKDVIREIKRKIMRIGMSNVLQVVIHPHATVVRVPSTIDNSAVISRKIDGCVWIVSEHVSLVHFPQPWGRCTASYQTIGDFKAPDLRYGGKWKIGKADFNIDDTYGWKKYSRKAQSRFVLNENTEVRTAKGSKTHVLVCTTHDASAVAAVEKRAHDYTVGNFYQSDSYARCVCNGVFQNTRAAYMVSLQCFRTSAPIYEIPTTKSTFEVLTPLLMNFTDSIVPIKTLELSPEPECAESQTNVWFAVYSNVYPTRHTPLPKYDASRDPISFGSMVYMGPGRGYVEIGPSGDALLIPRYDRSFSENDVKKEVLYKKFMDRVECTDDYFGFATSGIYTGDLNRVRLPDLADSSIISSCFHAGPTYARNVSRAYIGDVYNRFVGENLKFLFKEFNTYLTANINGLTKVCSYNTDEGFNLFGSINCYRMTIHSIVRAAPPRRGFLVPLTNLHELSTQIYTIAAETYKHDPFNIDKDADGSCILQAYTHGEVKLNTTTRLGACIFVSDKWLRRVYRDIVQKL